MNCSLGKTGFLTNHYVGKSIHLLMDYWLELLLEQQRKRSPKS